MGLLAKELDFCCARTGAQRSVVLPDRVVSMCRSGRECPIRTLQTLFAPSAGQWFLGTLFMQEPISMPTIGILGVTHFEESRTLKDLRGHHCIY